MAPSDKKLVDALEKTVFSIFHSGARDTLSVKKVRDKAEGELALEQGFFLQPEWKDKSKQLIKEYVGVLAEREEAGAPILVQPEPKKKATPAPKKVASPVGKRTQKMPPVEKSRPRKRQKKEETPEQEDSSDSSELSDEPSPKSGLSDSDASEVPKVKQKPRRNAKPPVKRQAKKREWADTAEENESEDLREGSYGDDDDDSDVKPAPKKKAAPKPLVKVPAASKANPKKAEVESPESTAESSKLTTPSESEEETKPTQKKKGKPRPLPVAGSDDELAPIKGSTNSPELTKGQAEEGAEVKGNHSESEMSVVLDEPSKRKRKQKATSSTKDPKPKVSKIPTTISATDEQLKILQAQLRKCGVRKIWQFELKQFGDDGKAKVRYLKDMLKDIGMTGRFSEARAKEIQEMRELQADLEAVKEGEKSWGLESGRRARGTVKKSMKVSSEDEDEDSNKLEKGAGGDTNGGSESEEAPRGRMRRVNQDLAFLGDEEESD